MEKVEKDDKDRGARSATLALLAARGPGATVCPSEVARSIAAATGTADWRGEMREVHAAIDSMVAEGLVRLSWKSETLTTRDGPYRIGQARGSSFRRWPPPA